MRSAGRLLLDFGLSKTVRWNPVLASLTDIESSNQKKIEDVSEMTCSIVTAR